MAYGKLTAVVGPMYAAKSTELLKRALWARNGEGRTVYVYKPAFDDRYSESEIVNHDGLRTPAESITALPDQTYEEGDLIVMDEIQFFDDHVEGDVVAWVRDRLDEGVEVVVAGLDMDWRGNPFPATADMLAMADEVVKKRANCTVCGRPAAKTHKRVPDDTRVQLGSTDTYEARCADHWRE